jgi:branched-chain amino acid transport system substrate-binding protein
MSLGAADGIQPRPVPGRQHDSGGTAIRLTIGKDPMKRSGSVAQSGIAAAAACLVMLAAAGCGKSPSSGGGDSGPATVTLGVNAALTGYLAASSDLPFVKGVGLAVDSINAAGGVAGHKFKVVQVDDASVAATGVVNTTKLITQNGADVILGGSLSAQCSGADTVVASHKTPMTCISPVANGSHWAFQVGSSLGAMISDELGFAARQLHAKKVAFLYSQTPYGQAGSKVLGALAGKFGITVVSNQGVDSNATDLSALMSKVKASAPDAVLDFLTGPVHVVEAKGAAAAGLTVPIVQTTDTTATSRDSAAAYRNLYFVALPPQAYPDVLPAIADANKALNDAATAGGVNMDQIAQVAYGWDAVHIIAAAITASSATTGEALRTAIESLTYAGCTSQFQYTASDHTGQQAVANPDSIGQFVNGTLKVVYQATAS